MGDEQHDGREGGLNQYAPQGQANQWNQQDRQLRDLNGRYAGNGDGQSQYASAGRPASAPAPSGYGTYAAASRGQRGRASYGPYAQPGASHLAGVPGVIVGPDGKPPLWAPWYGIGFGRAIARLFRKTFIYRGRASRSEYWWAWLFVVLVEIAIGVAATLISMTMNIAGPASMAGSSPADDFSSAVVLVAQAVFFLPQLSLSVRRLHDENMRGWWMLVPGLLGFGALVALFVGFVVSVLVPGQDRQIQIAIVTTLVTLGMYILSGIASVLMMVFPSNPAGVRFDMSRKELAAAERAADERRFGGRPTGAPAAAGDARDASRTAGPEPTR